MKALLIDPWARSVEVVEIPKEELDSIQVFYQLVGEKGLDFAYLREHKCAFVVGDHSALHDPPVPSFRVEGLGWPLYGRSVVIGYGKSGESLECPLSVEAMFELVEFGE